MFVCLLDISWISQAVLGLLGWCWAKIQPVAFEVAHFTALEYASALPTPAAYRVCI